MRWLHWLHILGLLLLLEGCAKYDPNTRYQPLKEDVILKIDPKFSAIDINTKNALLGRIINETLKGMNNNSLSLTVWVGANNRLCNAKFGIKNEEIIHYVPNYIRYRGQDIDCSYTLKGYQNIALIESLLKFRYNSILEKYNDFVTMLKKEEDIALEKVKNAKINILNPKNIYTTNEMNLIKKNLKKEFKSADSLKYNYIKQRLYNQNIQYLKNKINNEVGLVINVNAEKGRYTIQDDRLLIPYKSLGTTIDFDPTGKIYFNFIPQKFQLEDKNLKVELFQNRYLDTKVILTNKTTNFITIKNLIGYYNHNVYGLKESKANLRNQEIELPPETTTHLSGFKIPSFKTFSFPTMGDINVKITQKNQKVPYGLSIKYSFDNSKNFTLYKVSEFTTEDFTSKN